MSYSDEHLDQLLRASGEDWRASEPELEPFNVATLVRRRGQARSFSLPRVAGASLAVVLVAAVSVIAIYFTGPLGVPSPTLLPSSIASSTSTADTPTTGLVSPPPATSVPPSPSPTSNPGYGACSAIIDNIPLTIVKSGEAMIAAAYEVTGEQLTRYFVAELHDNPNFSNGADWWHNSSRLVDMCVFAGDFETMTPDSSPVGNETPTVARVLVIIDAGDAELWAVSDSDVGIPTTDPATIAATPTAEASSSPAEAASLLPLPNPGGTCSASQLVVGQATSQYETGTIVSSRVGVRQPVQNTGADCVLDLPQVVGFADQSGAFQAVEVGNLGQEVCKNALCKDVYPTSFQVKSGQTVTIEFNASWYSGNNPGFTPPPCAGTISDVTRAEFPLASGSIEIVWDTALLEVCTSPSSVSVTVAN